MAKRIWYLFIAVVVLIVGSTLVYANIDNVKDRMVWSRFRQELTPDNVTKIGFGRPGSQMPIADADKAQVLAMLQKATFSNSNRAGHGPTPDAVLTLTFKDGKRVHISMLSFADYELQPEPGSQFLIKASDLGIWLRNHFQGPAIG